MDLKLDQGKPETFGWQRRPDLDTLTGVAYEAPDGSLRLFPKGQKLELARLRMLPGKRGRPATGVKTPWKELGLSKATYYRRIRAL